MLNEQLLDSVLRVVIGFHVNFGAYGFWLPNDPRGSNSEYVRDWKILPFGKATRVENRRNVSRVLHDRELRLRAKRELAYPPVQFTGRQALSVANGFAEVAQKNGYILHACAILPCHVHLVIRPHRYSIEQVVNLLKGAATRRLAQDGLHPLKGCRARDGRPPSPWQQECGHEFLFTEREMRRAIDYVERNPLKEGKPPQHWSFVTPYTGEVS